MSDHIPYTPAKRLHHTTLSLIHSALLIATVIILSVLVMSSVTMFVKGMEMQQTNKAAKEYASPSEVANMEKSEMSQSVDSMEPDLMEVISSQNKKIEAIEDHNESILADLRQESNNIINKFNGWLGFWIAILAIFGGVVPIIIQYILREKSKREIEDMMEELRCKTISHQMQLMVTCLEIDKSDSVVTDSSVKPKFLEIYKAECYKSLKEFIDLSDNKQGFLDHTKELYLISILVQYCRLIEIAKINAAREELRKYNNLSDQIKRLIAEILNRKRYSRTRIWNQLLDIIPCISSI